MAHQSYGQTQATNITFSNIGTTQMDVSWANGDGANRLVVVHAGATVDADPVDANTYTSNAIFGSGTQLGAGNYVVYNGTGNSVTMTGLTPGEAYHVKVYEYNGGTGDENYNINTATGNPASQMINIANGLPPGLTAMYFDGVDDYVDVGDIDALDGVGQMTIEAWVKVEDLNSTTPLGIVDKGTSGTTRFGMLIGGSGSSLPYQIRLNLENGSNTHATTTSQPLLGQENIWIHIAMVFEGAGATNADRLKLFIDGVNEPLSFTGTIPATTHINSAPVEIGKTFLPQFFKGQIDEVKIFNVVRTQAEIQADMFTTVASDANLVAYWSFDDDLTAGNQTIAVDGSGNNNHGTLTDGPLWSHRVINTDDSGDGSLREAITQANEDTDTDFIDFSIPGGGVQTITPASALPDISESVIVNGYSQPESRPNTLNIGNDAVLNIQLDGIGASGNGLAISASNSEVYGLIIHSFNGGSNGIRIDGTGNIIAGCQVGIDASGNTNANAALRNTHGVRVNFNDNTIGLPTLAGRNTISGNRFNGILLGGSDITGMIIQNNYFGTSPGGLTLIGGGTIRLANSSAALVGGTTPLERNVVGSGISMNGSPSGGHRILGNYIGVGADGTTALGIGTGILFQSDNLSNMQIGGLAAGEANIIANNTNGILLTAGTASTGNSIRGNIMYGNTIGIDLGTAGADTNDTGDSDSGNNNLQNYPVLNSAIINGSAIEVSFNVDAIDGPSTYPLAIDFYISDGNRQGQSYIGSVSYTSGDAQNNFLASFTPLSTVNTSDLIVATATDANGNTSEFSAEFTLAAFVTTWNASDGTITIPTLAASGPYNYDIVWRNLTSPGTNEGSDTGQSGNYTIGGLTAGHVYQIEISGDFPHFYMNGNATEATKLLTVQQWGNITWASMSLAFRGCSNLAGIVSDVPNLSSVSNLGSMFRDAISFNQDISDWDVSSVTNMNEMFYAATSFNQSLGTWDISSITSMAQMLDNSGLSTANYDATLIGWVDNDGGTQTIPTGITLGAAGLTYCSAATAWTSLDDTYSWTIIDAGESCPPPATQATNIVFSNVGTTQMDVSWTNGTGSNRIVVAHAGAAVDADPTDQITYTANAVFTSGTQIGTSNYVVYDGTGSSVTVTGLTPGETYHFRVYEYNGTAGDENYNITTATGNPASQTTIPIPTITSFTPESGPVGTPVTITGTGFDPTSGNNIVFFGATQATVTAGNTTSLTVIVPVGSTYQPITVLSSGLIAWSASPFITTFDGGTIDLTSFTAEADQTTGTSPYSVAIGDLDGDGQSDLAVANGNSNTVSVFRNTSTGAGMVSYAAKVDYTTGSTPISVAIGDLDGDGQSDLAVANYIGNSVSVLRNTSSGAGVVSYAAKVDYTTGTRPILVSIGDLDGDGKSDLAVANYGGNSVSVFRNTSTGAGVVSYAAKVDYTTGTNPYSVAIGDLDGDGTSDLAVANFSSNTVSVFRNTSPGAGVVGYAANVDYPTGLDPASVSIGDLDGDGQSDLAVANFSSNTVSVFRNTSPGAGVVSYAAKMDYPTGSGPISVAIGDLDGDGQSDLALGNYNSHTVSVLRNTSTGAGVVSYAAKVDYTTGTNPYSVAIGDLDGDGQSDLAVANHISSTVSIFRNTVTPPDVTPPVVSIQNAPSIVNSTSAFNITIEFSEDVTDFVIGDISLVNGSASNFAVTDGNTYTVDITPDAVGNITIDVASSVAQDASSNGNAAATQVTVVYVAAPTTQATSLNFTNVAATSMTVNWTKGDGTNGIVVASTSPITWAPTSSATYVANASFGSGTDLDGGTYVVYNGISNTVDITGLTPGETYHFRVYEYNGTAGDENYNITTATGNPASQLFLAVATFTIDAIADANVNENSAYTSVTASLSGATPIGTLTYTLGGADAADFTIDAATGIVSMVVRDFENPEDATPDNVYELTITATDTHSNNDTEDWTVTVDDVIEAAVFTIDAIADVNVNENAVYTSVTPALSGATSIGILIYTLGGADAADFTINGSTGVVDMVARDFENPLDATPDNVYELTITATDSDGNNDTENWTVTVDNVIEAAVFTIDAIADVNINENSAYGSVAPSFSGATPIGTLTYTLGGADATDFAINGSTGIVSMVARDFETPADANTDNVYEVTITATDSDGNNDTEDWTVTVDDVTEAVAFTIDAIADANVNENAIYTSVTPNLTGATPIGTLTYTLGGADAADFTINGSTGIVSMVARDFENPEDATPDNVYELTITATDSDGNNDTEDWTVTVDDVTEVVVFTIDAVADANVDENVVYTSVTPALTGTTPVGTLTYTLGGTDAADFTINATSAVVSMVVRDFESPEDANTNNVYELTITATDSDGNNDTEDWTVTIDDVTEAVAFTIDAIADANVNENATFTSVTSNLTGATPIGTLTYTLGGADAGDFTIAPTTGVVSMVVRDFESPVDANTDNVYEVTITATDSDGNNDIEDWTVTVDDVIESAMFTIDAIADANVDENSTYTSVTPSLSGTTPIGTLTYSLGGADAADFTINGSTGVVSMVVRDFESPADATPDNVYELTITATDSDGNSGSESWAVTVDDVTEAAAFTIDAIVDANVSENSAYTSVTPNLSEAAPVGTLTYSLGGADAADFTINGSTGVVSMVSRDFENPADATPDNVYELTITATDSDGNNDTEDWTVTVDDVVEAAVFTVDAIANANVNENSSYTSVTPSLTGATPIGTLTYTLGGADAADFTIDSSTGVVSMVARDFESPEDADANNVYELTIVATDSDANSDSEAWTVTIDDVTEGVLEPEIAVLAGTAPFSSGDTETLVTSTQPNDATQAFTINNIGAADLTITGSSFADGSSYSASAITSPIAAGGSTTFTVTLDGSAHGTFSDVLTLSTNDSNQPDFIINLTGIIDPEQVVIMNGTIQISANSFVDMGRTQRDDPLVRTLMITNPSDSETLRISSVTVDNEAAFSITSYPAEVAPSSSAELILELTAASTGDFTGQITVESNFDTFVFSIMGEVTPRDQSIKVYNVLTPNNDGKHDFLKIERITEHPTNEVFIFNKTGKLVYEVSGYDNVTVRFEGNANVGGTNPLAAGTYYYVIKLGRGNKKAGFLQMSRD